MHRFGQRRRARFAASAVCAAMLLHTAACLADPGLAEPGPVPTPIPIPIPIQDAPPMSLLPSRFPVPGGPEWVIVAAASDFKAADAIPVRDLSGNWNRYRPRRGTNLAIQSSRVELSVSKAGWEVAATVRADFRISGPRSSWDAVHAYKQRTDPPDGSVFGVDAHDHGIVWAGLRGAHTWALRPGDDQGLALTAAVTLLSVQRLQQIDASGRIAYTALDGYRFQIDAQRQDSHKQFGGYGREDPAGSGYSADLGLLWRPSPGTFANVSAVDLLSRLRTRGVSTQQATLSSSTRSVGSDGYLAYQPLVRGRYSSQDVARRLDPAWSLTAGGQFTAGHRDVVVGGRFERIANIDLPAVWASVPLFGGVSAQADFEFRFRSVAFGLQNRYGGLMLRGRAGSSVGESRVLGWQAMLRLPI